MLKNSGVNQFVPRDFWFVVQAESKNLQILFSKMSWDFWQGTQKETCIRDVLAGDLSQKRDIACKKWPACMKRDLHIWKETCKRMYLLEISHTASYGLSKETSICKKRPVHMKRDLQKRAVKETCTRELLPVKRDQYACRDLQVTFKRDIFKSNPAL